MSFTKYNAATERTIQKFHASLNEKDSRRYAGSLYQILGHGSTKYICDLLAVSEKTLRKGLAELQKNKLPNPGRQRAPGGGRKKKWKNPDLNKAFNQVIEPFIAGDPMNEKIKWTNLSKQEIVDLLDAVGEKVSRGTVRRLLKHNGFKKRKIQKRKTLKKVAERDEQFKKINQAREDFKSTGDPLISADTKKKEDIGENQKEGTCYATGQLNGPDHTYSSMNTGKAVPHGIYDLTHNHAQINIGTSSETAEFLVDSILLWWDTYGREMYPDAKRILILLDAGGANSYRHHIFKKELQRLADGLKIEIVIKHYPSYTSKWNPIEHRVFPHVARTIKGVFIRTIEEFKKLVERAKTRTGLTVNATIIDKQYEIGRRAKKEDLKGCNISAEEEIGRWNYSVTPAC